MAIAQQDAVQTGVILFKAGNRGDLFGNHLGDIIPLCQLAGVHPLGFDFGFFQPLIASAVCLFQWNPADCPQRMPVCDLQWRYRVFDIDLHHRLGLVVRHAFGDFTIFATLAKHQVSLLDILDGFDAVRSMQQRVSGETLIHSYSSIIGHFEERDNALALAVGALDV